MLDDRNCRFSEVVCHPTRSIGVDVVVVAHGLAAELLGAGDPGGVGVGDGQARPLVGVLAVAEVLHLLEDEGEARREEGAAHLIQVGGDLGVVGRDRPERLGTQLLAELGRDDTALAQHYANADVAVQPTLSETYGMAAAEALAHGLPLVASATGAITELVGDDAGVLRAFRRFRDRHTLRIGVGDVIRDFAPGPRHGYVVCQGAFATYNTVKVLPKLVQAGINVRSAQEAIREVTAREARSAWQAYRAVHPATGEPVHRAAPV